MKFNNMPDWVRTFIPRDDRLLKAQRIGNDLWVLYTVNILDIGTIMTVQHNGDNIQCNQQYIGSTDLQMFADAFKQNEVFRSKRKYSEARE